MMTLRDFVVHVPVSSGSTWATAAGSNTAPTIKKILATDLIAISHKTMDGVGAGIRLKGIAHRDVHLENKEF